MKPLRKRTRVNLILLSLVVFLILVPIILAQGFGYKLGELGLVKTGGIYLHSDINNASIFIDDEYVKDSGLIIRNALLRELLPENQYEVVVIKDGLQDWRKTLTVHSSVVTEARVFMVPDEVEMDSIFPYHDREGEGTTTPPTVPLSENSTLTNAEYLDFVDLFEAEEEVATTSTGIIKRVAKHFIKLGIEDPENLENLIELPDQVAWLEDGDILINWVDDNKVTPYYYCLDPEECRTQVELDWENEIKAFDFLPGRDDVFVILIDTGLYAAEVDDRSDRNIQPIYLGEDLDMRTNERGQVVVRDGELFHILEL